MLETMHFRVWLGVLSLLCFTFSGEVSAAQNQVDAPTYRIAAGDTIQTAVSMEPGYTRDAGTSIWPYVGTRALPR